MIPVKKLIPLQDLDLKIDAANAAIEEKKQKIQKMQREIEADSELVEKKKALLKKIHLRKRAAESSFDSVNEQIKTADLKMKSAGLAPASYAALEKEIVVFRQKAGEFETSILQDMEKIEMLEKDIPKGEKVVAGRKVHLEEVRARVTDEILALKKEIELVKTERSQMSLSIEADSLEMYEDLRQQKKGRVIFDIDVASCPSCGMALPGGFVSSASSHDGAEKCSYCGILLYWTGDRN